MSTTYPIETGMTNRGLRAEVVDSMVKQIAAQTYKFKQAVAVVPTSAWKNTFFREDTSVSSGPTGNLIKGIPRGAAFPHGVTNWEEVSVRILKFGVEENIPWEDIISGELNVQARSIIRRTQEVTKAVDDYIWKELTQTVATDSNLVIQSYAITAGRFWDVSSAAIINDIMAASRYISTKNYDVSDLMCFVSPRDKQSIMTYLVDKGSQFPMIATDIANNGRIGRLAGVTLIESNSVAASYALLVKPKICATYKELVPLTSNTTEDPLKSVRIRIAEEGVIELTDPKAIVLIKGTHSTAA